MISGNEAVALAAFDAGVALGAGYPGTPSTEILEVFSGLGGRAQWSPNEKAAMEVTLGASFGGARTLTTMKHVGVNVAADVLFTAAYTGVTGAMVIVTADDPGMASSQNEQDNRRYAVAAGVPMLEPSDSQDAYDMTLAAIEISEQWRLPVLLRVTTRVCHTKTVIRPRNNLPPAPAPHFVRDIRGRVMIPMHARPAHRRLREKLLKLAAWNETSSLNFSIDGDPGLGIVTSGVSYMHVREAAPRASILKLGLTHPLPMEKIRSFVSRAGRCVVIEEGDPCLTDALRAAGMKVEGKAEMYRFGELNVERVRRILAVDVSPETAPPSGKAPQLCEGCPYRVVFDAFKELDCIVSGDIGCYTLGVLPPFEAMDMMVDMGAAMGMGLGLRHTLPEEESRRVVSVIGDSTFIHGGLPGLVDMVYNRPKTGHVVVILDNETTAMTGHQEHPGTGRTLNHEPAVRLSLENICRAMGVDEVKVTDPRRETFTPLLRASLASGKLVVIIARRPCLLIARKK